MSNQLWLFFFGLCLSFSGLAQNKQQAVALYNAEEYAEAAEIFEDLYKHQVDDFNYNHLLTCYRELKQLDKAEKLIKKRMRKNPDVSLWIDLGYYQHLQQKEDQATESYNKAIEIVKINPGVAYPVSEKFAKYGLYKEALNAYEVAERTNPNMRFNYQKGLIYAELGDMENMYREYLALIEYSPNYYQNVKARIARNINDDPNNTANAILKRQLIKRIQDTQNPLYSELLIWLYTEEMEFAKALRQLTALDKREGTHAPEIFRLGEKALAKKDYFVAQDCFEYVTKKGEMSGFYSDAQFMLLRAKREQLQSDPTTTDKQYVALIKEHRRALASMQGDETFVHTNRHIAYMQYFDLHQKDSAIAILERNINRFENTFKKPVAECKMLLGDILLAGGEPVEAVFKYMQVERAFKGTPIGDQAKYMKGMVAYYTADFPWALNQFEVLKSSTSKLISNDALQMALLITDNSTEDTMYQGLTYYAKADLYHFRNMPDSALYWLNMLLSVFPDHELVAEAKLLQANILVGQAKFQDAANELENLLAAGKGDIWSDDALMLLGEIYAQYIGDVDKAMAAYEKVVFEHPGSTFVPEARRRYRKLRGDNL